MMMEDLQMRLEDWKKKEAKKLESNNNTVSSFASDRFASNKLETTTTQTQKESLAELKKRLKAKYKAQHSDDANLFN